MTDLSQADLVRSKLRKFGPMRGPLSACKERRQIDFSNKISPEPSLAWL